jgi:hypothetical protein
MNAKLYFLATPQETSQIKPKINQQIQSIENFTKNQRFPYSELLKVKEFCKLSNLRFKKNTDLTKIFGVIIIEIRTPDQAYFPQFCR